MSSRSHISMAVLTLVIGLSACRGTHGDRALSNELGIGHDGPVFLLFRTDDGALCLKECPGQDFQETVGGIQARRSSNAAEIAALQARCKVTGTADGTETILAGMDPAVRLGLEDGLVAGPMAMFGTAEFGIPWSKFDPSRATCRRMQFKEKITWVDDSEGR